MAHRHRIKHSRTVGFCGPVVGPDHPRSDARAHGWVCEIDTCACGAERRRNRNQGAEERGDWEDYHQSEPYLHTLVETIRRVYGRRLAAGWSPAQAASMTQDVVVQNYDRAPTRREWADSGVDIRVWRLALGLDQV